MNTRGLNENLRGFNKNFAEASMKIIENRFEFETEQLILARQTASKIQQLPIQTRVLHCTGQWCTVTVT